MYMKNVIAFKLSGGFPMLRNRNLVKLLIAILVLGMIILPLLSAVVSADGETMPVFDFVKGIKGETDVITYYIKDVIITGNALESTEITVNIYWNKPMDEKSIVSKEKSWERDYSSEDWLLQKSVSCTVGAAGTFAIPVKIKIGRYKVEVIAKNAQDIMSYDVEIEYKDKNEITEEIGSRIFKNINIGLE